MFRPFYNSSMSLLMPNMEKRDANAVSALGLAHIGDCVYELLVRSRLCETGEKAVGVLHRKTVSMVNANAQCKLAEKILPLLSPEELAVFKRGRNAKVNSVPHNSSLHEYHMATGLEALFGWLFLTGRAGRTEELFLEGLRAENED